MRNINSPIGAKQYIKKLYNTITIYSFNYIKAEVITIGKNLPIDYTSIVHS